MQSLEGDKRKAFSRKAWPKKETKARERKSLSLTDGGQKVLQKWKKGRERRKKTGNLPCSKVEKTCEIGKEIDNWQRTIVINKQSMIYLRHENSLEDQGQRQREWRVAKESFEQPHVLCLQKLPP